LSIIDYVVVSGDIEGHFTEYVDHLHEHMVHPVTIRDGNYVLPADAGYSSQIKPQTLVEYDFPSGSYWTDVHPRLLAEKELQETQAVSA
jgi:L-fuconate dehydratase